MFISYQKFTLNDETTSKTLPKIIIYSFVVQAAKETGALQEAKTKLEKRCEELTWRLQLEKRLRVRDS